MKQKHPIGIFDSGIGGLTVAQAIRNLMPGEDLIYFGDTAHMPYGDKSDDSIKYYSIKISHFLLKQNVKAIVMACNTASALAFNVVREFVDNQVPVFNVIDPMVDFISKKYDTATKIGIIGTKATIRSKAYEQKLHQNGFQKVASLATPLLAPMIEEGFFNNNISRTIIHSYLGKRKLRGIKALVLACTHYPLIKKDIIDYYQGKVDVLDSADITAEFVQNALKKNNLLNTQQKQGKNEFYVSELTESFQKSSHLFFKSSFRLKEKNIWI